ncbi:MAG TPA: polysaccharide deacetylase family protein, partial [Burkholderiales bacterium]|nr:polysaccharide deacetylase family protein [Burkholderiales bacterium]
WRDAGRTVDFWWRDDDATAPTPPVRRLLSLSRSAGVPLALAVIPLDAQAELFADLEASVLMHGTDHRNRAGPGEKKTEFAAEADDDMLVRLSKARERLARLAGARFVPVLAPPWNRFKRGLIARLGESGLRGLSAYGPRPTARAAGISEVNTHVDIIDWRGTRAFCGEENALGAAVAHLAARRGRAADPGEATGWLTHHAVHDGAAWDFLERLFERTRKLGVRWADAETLFTSSA